MCRALMVILDYSPLYRRRRGNSFSGNLLFGGRRREAAGLYPRRREPVNSRADTSGGCGPAPLLPYHYRYYAAKAIVGQAAEREVALFWHGAPSSNRFAGRMRKPLPATTSSLAEVRFPKAIVLDSG
jgi:hypothetical protein